MKHILELKLLKLTAKLEEKRIKNDSWIPGEERNSPFHIPSPEPERPKQEPVREEEESGVALGLVKFTVPNRYERREDMCVWSLEKHFTARYTLWSYQPIGGI